MRSHWSQTGLDMLDCFKMNLGLRIASTVFGSPRCSHIPWQTAWPTSLQGFLGANWKKKWKARWKAYSTYSNKVIFLFRTHCKPSPSRLLGVTRIICTRHVQIDIYIILYTSIYCMLIYVDNVNPGLINHGLLIRGYSSNSHNRILKWYPPN